MSLKRRHDTTLTSVGDAEDPWRGRAWADA